MQASQACSYMFLLQSWPKPVPLQCKNVHITATGREQGHTFLETWDWVPRIDFEAPEDKRRKD